jgi:NADH:ubiquinone oxidoreductase subunit F (NADH-binding)
MKETKIITRLWGKINPCLIDSYINEGGYVCFGKCLSGKLSPEKVRKIIIDSGLRGRGGAGFKTGEKWELATSTARRSKKNPILIINADESQPGTFKDRLMLEKNPQLVIEGALIAAYALSAKKVLFYINGNYREQFKIVEEAIKQAEAKCFLSTTQESGKKIIVQPIRGAGGYIYGEETAQINSLEGQRGEPRVKPPYPVVKGLFGRPTVVNNVETIANIVPILELGVSEFKKFGVPGSWGTKLFSVSGTVKNPGVFELPLGSSLGNVLKDCCGWMANQKQFSFARIGGTGKFLGKEALSYPLIYGDAPGEINVGLGDILVVDKNVSLKDLMEAWSSFYRRESCGQCTPCREGTFILAQMAERMKENDLKENDWLNLENLLEALEKTALCPLGGFATKHWREFLRIKKESRLKKEKNKK